MNDQLDVNDIINGLLDQIAAQAREIAILKATIASARKAAEIPKED